MPKRKYVTFPEAIANRAIVEALMQHLLNSLNEFIEKYPDDTISFRDVLMGSHNFHVAAILDIVERTNGETLWIDSAIATFEMRMQREKEKWKSQSNLTKFQ